MGNGGSVNETALPSLVGLIALATLGLWVKSYFAPVGIQPRDLGSPAQPSVTTTQPPKPSMPVQAASQPSVATAPAEILPGEWPCFRGPNHDNVAEVKLPKDLTGLKLAWTIPLGEGYAAPIVKNGRVYLLDYDTAQQQDVLRCFSLADGSELWHNGYPVVIKRNHGISRTIPATDGKVVVSLGPKCQVLAADALTGKTLWSLDLVKQYGTAVPNWYAGQCPLIDGSKLILAPGGSSLAIAVDLASGKVLWKSPNPRQWAMTHSSLVPMTLDGHKTYVYCGSGGVAGISADDGKILWDSTDWIVSTATVPTPVPLADNRLFLCGGYNAGSMMLQIQKNGASYAAKQLYKLDSGVFGSDQQTPILLNSHLYGVVPGGEMVCLDLAGKRVWASGSSGRFGLGPYIAADGRILALNDAGMLTMLAASPDGYRALGTVQLLKGRESWGPMALAGNRLLARDLNNLVCVSLGG